MIDRLSRLELGNYGSFLYLIQSYVRTKCSYSRLLCYTFQIGLPEMQSVVYPIAACWSPLVESAL